MRKLAASKKKWWPILFAYIHANVYLFTSWMRSTFSGLCAPSFEGTDLDPSAHDNRKRVWVHRPPMNQSPGKEDKVREKPSLQSRKVPPSGKFLYILSCTRFWRCLRDRNRTKIASVTVKVVSNTLPTYWHIKHLFPPTEYSPLKYINKIDFCNFCRRLRTSKIIVHVNADNVDHINFIRRLRFAQRPIKFRCGDFFCASENHIT